MILLAEIVVGFDDGEVPFEVRYQFRTPGVELEALVLPVEFVLPRHTP